MDCFNDSGALFLPQDGRTSQMDGLTLDADVLPWSDSLQSEDSLETADALPAITSSERFHEPTYFESDILDMDNVAEVDTTHVVPDLLSDLFDLGNESVPAAGTGTIIDLDLDQELRHLLEGPTSGTAVGSSTQRKKNISGGYPCGGCSKIFDRQCDLNKHYKRAHLTEAAPPFPCPGCPKRFCDRKDLNRHVSGQHASSLRREDQPSSTAHSPWKRRRLHVPPMTVEKGHAPSKSPDISRKRSKEAQTRPQYPSADAALKQLTTLMLNLDVNEDHQTSESEYHPYEMVSVHEALVVVTSRDLVLELRSDFNPRSEFKLRSITVPRQRMKIGRSLRQLQDYPPEEYVRLVVVDRCQMIMEQMSNPEDLSWLVRGFEASTAFCVKHIGPKVDLRPYICQHTEYRIFGTSPEFWALGGDIRDLQGTGSAPL